MAPLLACCGGLSLLRAEYEALVAVRADFIALLTVKADATRIRHEHPRLAGDVSAQIPRIGEHEQRLLRDLVDVRHPSLLRFGVGLDHVHAALTHVLDELRNPLDVLLD